MPNNIIGGTFMRTMRESMADLLRHMIEMDRDPVTSGIVLNTDRVRTVSSLGRQVAGTQTGSVNEFEAIHPVQFGRAGTIKYGTLVQSLRTSLPPQLDKSLSAYPTASKVAQRNTDWMLIPLKWIQGNLVIERRQWLALTSGETVGTSFADWIRDPLETILQQLTTDFFGNEYGEVAELHPDNPGSTIADGSVGEIQTVDNGRVRPLWRGQRLAAFTNDSGNPGDADAEGGQLVVTSVSNFDTDTTDGLNVTKFSVLNDGGGGTYTPTANDHLCLQGGWDGTTKAAVQGLETWLDNGEAIHGLSKSDNPELKSYSDVPTNSRWPTPSVFEKAMDRIYDRGFEMPTRWITTRGVRSLYFQAEGLYKSYHTELAAPVQRGADGGYSGDMQITTEQGTAEMMISAFAPSGVAYGIREDVLVRYAPKGIDAIQFVGEADIVGNQMFLVSTDSSGDRIPIYEAPFDFWIENGCVKPQCLAKIGSLKQQSEVI